MQVVNGVLFYSSLDIDRIPAGKDISDIIPKNGKYWDTRRIETSFYEIKKDVTTKDGIKTLVHKLENSPGPNRAQRRKSQKAGKKRTFNQQSFYKRFMKKRGQPINTPLNVTPKKWISIQAQSGISKKLLLKWDMYKACKEATKSRLAYDTFIDYIDLQYGE